MDTPSPTAASGHAIQTAEMRARIVGKLTYQVGKSPGRRVAAGLVPGDRTGRPR